MNILIVDDSEENCYLLQSLLRGNGYQTVSARNGAEALGVLQSEKVDLIVSDILMPVMDGFQLCRLVRTHETLKEIPFIVYTATYTGTADEEFARKIGADMFIQKPCEPDSLLHAVEDVIKTTKKHGASSASNSIEEEEVLRLYSERLIRKLEQKMLEAESELKARKKVERELIKSQKRLIQAQRIARMGDFSLNIRTGEVTWSEAMFDLLQYNADENLSLLEIQEEMYHPDDKEHVKSWLKNAIASGEELHPPLEYRILNSSGDTIHVQTHLSVRYQSGQACEIIGTVQDISKRKEEEEERELLKGQLAQAQRLESVGRLVNSVAHDFNNLLTVILGRGEIILSKLDANNPIREEIEQIVDAGRRSASLSQQLLAFSRKQNLKKEKVNLNKILLAFRDILVRLVGESVYISLSLDDNLRSVLADPVRLEQVIMNIAVNAKDAMQNGGKLEIITENRYLNNEFTIIHPEIEPGDYVQLSISDTGSGIEKDILPKIFDPFFSTKSEESGTGLGLSTVYGIVKQLEGYILVDSTINKGTTFTMLFPATDM